MSLVEWGRGLYIYIYIYMFAHLENSSLGQVPYAYTGSPINTASRVIRGNMLQVILYHERQEFCKFFCSNSFHSIKAPAEIWDPKTYILRPEALFPTMLLKR